MVIVHGLYTGLSSRVISRDRRHKSFAGERSKITTQQIGFGPIPGEIFFVARIQTVLQVSATELIRGDRYAT